MQWKQNKVNNLEKVKYLQDIGYIIISENLGDALIVKCKNSHTFARPFNKFITGNISCSVCKKEEKINFLNSLGFTPVSENLGNNLEVECFKGHKFKRDYDRFIKGNVLCPICDKEEKINFLNSLGFTPVSENLGDNLRVKCLNGHVFSRSYNKFTLKENVACPICEKEQKHIYLRSLNFKAVSEHLGDSMVLECDKGHIFKRTYNNIIAKGATTCPICFPQISSAEIEINNLMKELNVNAIISDWTILTNKELDIYVPEKKLAIEFNGIYWHSELMGKTQKYHLQKTEECLKKGIELLHIFENEWKFKKEIWKSIILGKLGKHSRIFARNTELKEVPKEEERQFLEENHLQGFVGSRVCLGLYKDEELLCLMSFGKNRFSSNIEWELLRFASKKEISVVGGASKLFKHFVKDYSSGLGIVSYSDRRYSQGNMYLKLGFKFSHNSQPNYFYFKTNNVLQLESRQKYMKHKLPKVLESFNSELTEWQNMQNNGFNRIWDCGNSVWKFIP